MPFSKPGHPKPQLTWLFKPSNHPGTQRLSLNCFASLLTLEPVRPGLTAKGSFKKSKSPELQRAIWSISLVSLKPECLTSRKKKSFFSCLILFSPASDFFLLPQFFSPGSKASRKSGLTRTQIKTFSRSKVNPETVKKQFGHNLPKTSTHIIRRCKAVNSEQPTSTSLPVPTQLQFMLYYACMLQM